MLALTQAYKFTVAGPSALPRERRHDTNCYTLAVISGELSNTTAGICQRAHVLTQ